MCVHVWTSACAWIWVHVRKVKGKMCQLGIAREILKLSRRILSMVNTMLGVSSFSRIFITNSHDQSWALHVNTIVCSKCHKVDHMKVKRKDIYVSAAHCIFFLFGCLWKYSTAEGRDFHRLYTGFTSVLTVPRGAHHTPRPIRPVPQYL